MRKPRVIIFDDELFVLNMLKDFFEMRGYEVLPFNDSTTICPAYGDRGSPCRTDRPCCDIMITDFAMPGVNGLELIETQTRKGCKLGLRNKVVISGYIDEASLQRVRELGCGFLKKPFSLEALTDLVVSCEKRVDLNQPLATWRKEDRFDSHRKVTFRISSTDQLYTGVTVNISPSGLCLKASTPLRREDMVTLDTGHLPSCQQASVRWVRQIDGGSYLAGLHCA